MNINTMKVDFCKNHEKIFFLNKLKYLNNLKFVFVVIVLFAIMSALVKDILVEEMKKVYETGKRTEGDYGFWVHMS